jgi:hypothetical protein
LAFWPKPLRQAMSKLAAAATCSTDCSALPPGSGQSAWTVGSGRKKSAPFSASACSTFWSKAMTEIRWPWVARVLFFPSCRRD